MCILSFDSVKFNRVLSSSVATSLGHLYNRGHLDHFFSGSKWVSPGLAYMPDPDQNYLSCPSKTAMKRLILSNRAVTSILRMRS